MTRTNWQKRMKQVSHRVLCCPQLSITPCASEHTKAVLLLSRCAEQHIGAALQFCSDLENFILHEALWCSQTKQHARLCTNKALVHICGS